MLNHDIANGLLPTEAQTLEFFCYKNLSLNKNPKLGGSWKCFFIKQLLAGEIFLFVLEHFRNDSSTQNLLAATP